MTLILQHPQTEDVKIVKVWFSGTVFIYGFFPLIYRGVYLHALALLILSLPTAGMAQGIYAFFINKLTAKHYLKKGYLPVDNLALDYAKAKWNLTELNVEAIPTNKNLELASQLRQRTATRWAMTAPIIVIFGILASVAIPKLVKGHEAQQQTAIEANTLTEDTNVIESEKPL
jgi:hypothetical protein